MQCIFIHGPVASGKLTVARALQDATGLPLFHNHLAVDAALALFEFGSPGFVRLREATWLTAFREAARAGQSFIFTFHPEASVPATFIASAIEAIESEAGTILFVELQCADAVIEARLSAPSRASYRKLTSLELYRQLRDRGAFAFPPMPAPHLVIDTAVIAPEEAAERIRGITRLQRRGSGSLPAP